MLCAASLAGSHTARAATEEDVFAQAELLHSDLPLYDFSYQDVWPQHFSSNDGDFGCTSRIAFGNWTFTDNEGETGVWQIANYGVFHCAAIFRQAETKADLANANYKYGLAAFIGTTEHSGKPIELWAFQMGMRPGSDYVLLARAPGQGIVKSFSVLQRFCSKARTRRLPEGRTLDIWSTGYCTISSRSELLSLAKQALGRPPLGKLEWTEQEDEK